MALARASGGWAGRARDSGLGSQTATRERPCECDTLTMKRARESELDDPASSSRARARTRESLAAEADVPPGRAVAAALRLLVRDGCTIPFVARYRKEATGGLDEVALRRILAEHEERERLEALRAKTMRALADAGSSDPTLVERARAATSRYDLEDILAGVERRARSRGAKAREAGCDALAERLLASGTERLEREVNAFARSVGLDAEEALSMAKDVLAERAAGEASARAAARKSATEYGRLTCERTKLGANPTDDRVRSAVADVRDYWNFSAPVGRVRPHQMLAISRAEANKVLRVKVEFDESRAVNAAMNAFVGSRKLGPGCYGVVKDAVEDGVKRLLVPSIEREVKSGLKTKAMDDAVERFGANLRALLLTAPMRPSRVVLGVDPAYRTGCKLAVVDATGALLDTGVVYLQQFESKMLKRGEPGAEERLREIVRKWKVGAIAIGNGVASQETQALVCAAFRDAEDEELRWEVVNEAGASVYSASELAAKELPGLDVSLRGAVSIARRAQDPMAELVKIDPQSIGVGLYQHDVKGKRLEEELTATVESAVARVGANANTASESLLARIPSLGPALAAKIVAHRSANGPFRERAALRTVPGVGSKTYEQIVGFLRVPDAKDALERTGIHPESYHIARKLLRALDGDGFAIDLTNDREATSLDALRRLNPKLVALLANDNDIAARAASLGCHPLTLRDIASELAAPGADARERDGARAGARGFRGDDIRRVANRSLDNLRPGDDVSDAVVRNVVPFGVFVDIGAGRDALLHVSAVEGASSASLASRFRVGDRVDVRVADVDPERRRINLRLAENLKS